MPSIILKKTFKVKPSGFKVANEKSFSFHGRQIDPKLISAINHELGKLHLMEGAHRLRFKIQEESQHYVAPMNHNFQKYHEEDAVVVILDVMEEFGWTFRFEYDTEVSSIKGTGDSFTKRELFLFHTPLTKPSKIQIDSSRNISPPRKTDKLLSKSEKITSSTRRTEESPPPPLQKMNQSERVSSVRKKQET